MNARSAHARSIPTLHGTTFALLVTAVLLPVRILPAQPVVSGCGTISGDVVWDAGSLYVLDRCGVTIPAGASLTIEPGTIVKLAGSHDMITVDGSLVIAGDSGAPVVLTSLRDDSVGGDTNGDGAAGVPAPGDWGWVVFNAGSHGRIQDADIAYGGVGYHGYTQWAMVKVYGPADVAVDRSTLRRSWSDGLFTENASVRVTRSRITSHGIHSGATYGLNVNGLDPNLPLDITDNVFETARPGESAAQIKIGHHPAQISLLRNQAGGSGWNGLVLEGRVERDLLLAADTGLPLIVAASVSVAPGATLSVPAGVVVKLTGCGAKIVVEGALRASGADDAPVVLTSLMDDGVAGDTNGDGAASAPAPTDWGYVRFSAGAAGTWEHAALRYGGVACTGYDNYSMLQAYAADLGLQHTTLAHSFGNGLYAENSSVSVRNSRIVDSGQFGSSAGLHYNGLDPARRLEIGDTVFETRSPVQTAARLTFGSHPATIVLQRNVASGSGRNGIVLAGTVQHDLALDVVDSVPFIVEGGLGVAAGATLSLTPGTLFKLTGCGRKIAVDGALVARGTGAAPIGFTSLADDSRGGDTNGDGAATVPRPSDWGYVGFAPRSAGTLAHVFLGYGGIGCSGYDLYTMLAADDALVEVDDATFEAYRWNAVYGSEARLRIRRSRFPADLADDPMAIRNGGRRFWVDARHNWWGDASGPYHPTRNPSGLGAAVTDLVRFLPWAIDASGTETTQVLVEGPSRVSPGDTAAYVVDYFAGRAIDDAVVVVALPVSATYVPGSGGGLYRPDRHELFWRLGTLPAAAEGRLAFELSHAWGQPANSEANVAALMLGGGLPGALAADSYLAWEDVAVRDTVPLGGAELATERSQHPDLDQILTALTGDGFVLADANRLHQTTGDTLTKVVLVDRQRNATAIVDRNADGATAVASYPASVVLGDASGSAALDLDTYALTLGGTWAAAPARGARTAQATFSACLSNCIAENKAAFLSRTRAKLSGIAACRRWLWDGIAGAEKDCLRAIARLPLAALDVRNSVDLTGCLGTCSVEPSLHFCVEDQVYCYPDIGLGTGSWVHTCDTATGTLRAPKFERCAAGEPCIQSVGCYARALAAGRVTGKLSTAVRVARDPNAKLGKAGDVLPDEWLTYTVTFENEGAGTAYGVYVRDELGPEFDVDTLDLQGEGEFVAATRTILWEVGELAPKGEPGSKGERTFRVRLRADLPDGTVVANQATVFFPSVPEETATNTVVNVLQPLVAVPQHLATTASQAVGIALAGSGAGGGVLTFELRDGVLNGELTGVPPNLTYAPAADFNGQDRFTFVVDDGARRSRPAEVTIAVAPSDTDTTAPRVLWTWPASDAVLHEVSSEPVGDAGGWDVYAPMVRIGFSESMDPLTISEASLTIYDGTGTALPVAVRWDGAANEAVLAPLQVWADGTYTVAVETAAMDAAGNPLDARYAWRFRIASGAGVCVGDCNGDTLVTVDELVRAVNIALGSAALELCRAADRDADGAVGIDELVGAVNAALLGCPR